MGEMWRHADERAVLFVGDTLAAVVVGGWGGEFLAKIVVNGEAVAARITADGGFAAAWVNACRFTRTAYHAGKWPECPTCPDCREYVLTPKTEG